MLTSRARPKFGSYQAFLKEPSFEPLLRLLSLLLQRFGDCFGDDAAPTGHASLLRGAGAPGAPGAAGAAAESVDSVAKLTLSLVAVADVLTAMQGDYESSD